jgi:hypothetical protein
MLYLCGAAMRQFRQGASQMESRQLAVIDTMNVVERARALEGMHQALLLESFAHAISSRVRRALNSAWHAMTLVYGGAGN